MHDGPGTELAVILPVYNEGEAVEPVLRALSSAVRTPHELVVVYDFDGDTTVPVVARLAGEIPGLRGLRILNAMKAGIAEVPTTWRDRTAGQSNFKLRKWLPHYLHSGLHVDRCRTRAVPMTNSLDPEGQRTNGRAT
jgi:hypothetical protein